MKLRQWRLKSELTLAECVPRFGAANPSMVSRWERGVMVPGKAAMGRIYVATAGAVTPNDFYELPALPEQVAA